MEISKSTPYVRYRENISSTLHKGTIHIESEYLDRERKTTIESIEGQTWQNMVNGENKEEDILPRLGLKIEGNEDMLDSVEQHMPIDTIIGDVEPVANDDGTYTYEISTMEGSYAKTLDGENNLLLTSDGIVGDMYIKYNAQGEEVNGNIVMDGQQSSYTIENSNTGEINSAILSGNTLVNISIVKEYSFSSTQIQIKCYNNEMIKTNTEYTVIYDITDTNDLGSVMLDCFGNTSLPITLGSHKIKLTTLTSLKNKSNMYISGDFVGVVDNIMIIEGDHTQEDIPYFEGMQSVKMPVLTTSNEDGTKTNILTINEPVELRGIGEVQDTLDCLTGEVTERIGEIVLDGSDLYNIEANTLNETHARFAIHCLDYEIGYRKPMLCDVFPTDGDTHTRRTIFTYYDGFVVCIEREKLVNVSTDGFKQYLQQNPTTVQYQLETESIKTVDLSVVDQDDKIIQSLHTYPSTTHINLSSDGLIPNAEINYTMYGNIGETTGEQITDGTDSKLIEGKIYGDTLLNVLPSPSLKNSMDYNISMQKLNDGYDNVIITDIEFKEVTLYGQTMVNIEGIKSVENPTIIITNSPMRFGKGGRK